MLFALSSMKIKAAHTPDLSFHLIHSIHCLYLSLFMFYFSMYECLSTCEESIYCRLLPS